MTKQQARELKKLRKALKRERVAVLHAIAAAKLDEAATATSPAQVATALRSARTIIATIR